MFQKIIPAVITVFLSLTAFAQQEDSIAIKKIANEILINGTAYENLRYLCKKIGPRLSGSIQAEKAVYATVKMLKDAGADTVYLQPCMVPHWVRGEKEVGYIKLPKGEKYNLNLCALGNSEGTGKQGITGKIIEVKSFDELEQLGVGVIKGNIVFFNFEMNPTYISTFSAYSESGKGRRIGPTYAAKFGAIGVLVRSLASNPDDYPHTGATQYNDSFPKIAAFAISTNNAIWLSIELKKNPLLGVYLKNSSKMLPDVPSYNVVGEIKGSEFPKEFITVGGHLDSWDLAEGANDDGSGCMQSIEVLRAFKATHTLPKRTIRAVMFMNEENGGRGAAKYVALAKINKEKHIFGLESDDGGFSPRGFSLDVTAEKLAKIQQWKNLFYQYGVYEFVAGGSGSDIGPLKEIGTPVGGLKPDSQRYFDIHHASTDVFENVSRRELHLGALNMAALIFLIDKYGL